MRQEQPAARPTFRWRWIAVWEAVLGCSTILFVTAFSTFNDVMRGFVASVFAEGPGKAWPLAFAFVVPVAYEALRFALLWAWFKVSSSRLG